MGDSAHQEVTKREFARQSSNFEKPDSLFRNNPLLEWIAASVPVPDEALILDVAGGTGQTGRFLGQGSGGAVVVLDLTDEMLAAGMNSVQEEGRHDVSFVRGEADSLPFPSGQFDVVVCHGGEPTGLHAARDEAGELTVTQRWVIAGT